MGWTAAAVHPIGGTLRALTKRRCPNCSSLQPIQLVIATPACCDAPASLQWRDGQPTFYLFQITTVEHREYAGRGLQCFVQTTRSYPLSAKRYLAHGQQITEASNLSHTSSGQLGAHILVHNNQLAWPTRHL